MATKLSYLKSDDFIAAAPSQADQQVHVDHRGCPAGVDTKRRLYIKRLQDRTILAYCHHCGGKGVYNDEGKRVNTPSLSEVRNKLLVGEQLTEYVDLPDDAEMDPQKWPAKAAAWLYKHRFTDGEIIYHGICYSPFMDRVIIPTRDDDGIISWQARALYGQEPKYLSKTGAKKYPHYLETVGDKHTIIVVEDVLSAIRIHKLEYNVIALKGTSIDMASKAIVSGYKNVIIWMDDDKAGHEAAAIIRKEIAMLVDTTVKVEAPEAKRLSDTQIEEVISKH